MRLFHARQASRRLLARALVTVLLGAAISGCSWFGDKPDITKDWSAARLYSAAKERLENKDYEKAIDYYEKLEARYPFGPHSQQAQLDIAYAIGGSMASSIYGNVRFTRDADITISSKGVPGEL